MAFQDDISLSNLKLPVNISEKQRTFSAIAGGALLALGVLDFSKSSFRRAVRMTLGSLLLLRSKTGYCPMTAAMKEAGEKAGDALSEPAYAGS
jgi:uncharacterized membrane protein